MKFDLEAARLQLLSIWEDNVADRDSSSVSNIVPFQVNDRFTWLAIEVTKCAREEVWKMEIATDTHKTIAWPDRFNSPEQAIDVVQEFVAFWGQVKVKNTTRSKQESEM